MKDKFLNSVKDKTISIEILRAYVGLALVYKGIYFIGHMKEIFEVVSYHFPYLDFLLSHYIVLAHIGGGLCLALGIFTRVAALANLPIMLFAMFFSGANISSSEFELVGLVFVLMLFFMWQGSGYFSVDNYIKLSHDEGQH